MTPEEAAARIDVSRRHLAGFVRMVDGGTFPFSDLDMMERELAYLEMIADRHPSKTDEIAYLGKEWMSLMSRIRAKLN